jgi:hypothetical protein
MMDISARCVPVARKDHLEYAVDALLQWPDQVESVIKENSSFDRRPGLYYE